MEQKQSFQQMMLEKQDIQLKNNNSRHRLYTPLKNGLKMDHRPKYKMQNYKLLERI